MQEFVCLLLSLPPRLLFLLELQVILTIYFMHFT